MNDTRPRWSIAPYFVVDDVVATATFYRDMLGFKYERFRGDPPAFTMVYRSGVVIMLGQLAQTGAASLMRPNSRADRPPHLLPLTFDRTRRTFLSNI